MIVALLIAGWLLPSAPGAINPSVSQDNVSSTICVRGWTAKVRPNVDVTEALKHKWLPPGHRLNEYELDHIIPLELGGALDSENNLWMQPIKEARIKDKLENKLKVLVCHHKLSLDEAQHAIASDWAKAYSTYVGKQ